tara:strand:- start:28977 stop:29342 length:366 start_codon:yes stop_codon:yes gene_type:complete
MEKKFSQEISDTFVSNVAFNSSGLVPAIVQQYDTKEVLMMAWMNEESIHTTFKEGYACYWSRSRKNLWRKGETSGNVQKLKDIRIDCDGDTLLLLVDQKGDACHLNYRSCFFRGADTEIID